MSKTLHTYCVFVSTIVETHNWLFLTAKDRHIYGDLADQNKVMYKKNYKPC